MIHLKIRDRVISYGSVDRLEVVPLTGMFGRTGRYGINLYYNRPNTLWGPTNNLRISEHNTKEEADSKKTEHLEAIAKVVRTGAGTVSIM